MKNEVRLRLSFSNESVNLAYAEENGNTVEFSGSSIDEVFDFVKGELGQKYRENSPTLAVDRFGRCDNAGFGLIRTLIEKAIYLSNQAKAMGIVKVPIPWRLDR